MIFWAEFFFYKTIFLAANERQPKWKMKDDLTKATKCNLRLNYILTLNWLWELSLRIRLVQSNLTEIVLSLAQLSPSLSN